jgi:transcriptional regulator with XRE-family HTH domain
MSVSLNDMATLRELTARAQARRELPAPTTRRALRNAVGASLDDVASVVGVTRQAVSLWELGQRAPSATNLERYLEVIRAFKDLVADSRPAEQAAVKEVNPKTAA